MAFITVNSGTLALVNRLTGYGGYSLSGCLMHLFTNNHAPLLTDTLSNYTEAGWTGYAAQQLTAFGGATLNLANQAISSPNACGFGNSSGSTQVAQGYFITDSTGTQLLGAEQFQTAPPGSGIAINSGSGLLLQWTYAQISNPT